MTWNRFGNGLRAAILAGACAAVLPHGADADPAKEKPAKSLAPGVPTRKNPFEPNTEIRRVLDSIPAPPGPLQVLPPKLELYQEFYRPLKGGETLAERDAPAVPPMRLLGMIQGSQLSALLQVGSGPGSRVEAVVPGREISFGTSTYRVERIEGEKVTLVNRWEGGVQRIEVPLPGTAPAR